MPTVLRVGPYRIHFFSHEPNEPPHVHVDRDDQTVKFWLSPISMAYNIGFAPRELRKIERIVAQNQQLLLDAWHERFGA